MHKAQRKAAPKAQPKNAAKKSSAKKAPQQQKKRAIATKVKRVVTKSATATAVQAPSFVAPKRLFSTGAETPFQPTSNRILVKKDVVEKAKTAGGILLPQSQAKNSNPLATVVAVGPGLRNNEGKYVATFTRIGDKVVLPDFGGAELKFNNESFFVYRDDDVLGVISQVNVAERINAV